MKDASVIEREFDYDIDPIYLNEDMSNKLFCTFAQRIHWTTY